MSGSWAFSPRAWGWGAALPAAVLLGLLTGVYLHAAFRHAREVNTDAQAVDQSAYLNYAKRMRDTGYGWTGDRNRMPVYPFLLSLLYRDGVSDAAFFERAKSFNIWLSVVLLAGLLALFARYLPPFPSVVLILVTAFSVFVYRAPYVQCELLYYSLSFAGFLLASETLRRPGWAPGAAAGAVLALAHLTKASAPPAVVVLGAVGGLLLLRRPFDWRRPAAAGLAVAAFLLVLFPYLYTSKRVFGRWFYNVNSTFYMWYDTREQIFAGTRAHGDRAGWPDLPPEEIPGMTKYLREHGAGEIAARLGRGVVSVWRTARGGYGYLNYLGLLALFAAAAVAASPRAALALARDRLPPLLYAAGYLAAYLLLYAWISQVHAGLPRLILALFLPAAFCLARVACSDRLTTRRARLAGGVVLLALLAIDIGRMLAGGILTVRGGS